MLVTVYFSLPLCAFIRFIHSVVPLSILIQTMTYVERIFLDDRDSDAINMSSLLLTIIKSLIQKIQDKISNFINVQQMTKK